MEIKNEIVKIKTGGKEYEFKNRILPDYTRCFIKSQLDENAIDYQRQKPLLVVLFKFDTPLERKDNYRAKDFDIANINSDNIRENRTANEITCFYDYDIQEVAAFTGGGVRPLTDFEGRKVTAIGFIHDFMDAMILNTPVKAILDTSLQNIFIHENMSITRKDTITTNKKIYSKDIDFPFHLSPLYNFENTTNLVAKLISFSFTSYLDNLDVEYPITNVDEFFDGSGFLKEIDASSFSKKMAFTPSATTHPGFAIPINTQSKYYALRYKIYSYSDESGEYTDTGKEYLLYDTLDMPVEKRGALLVHYYTGGKR